MNSVQVKIRKQYLPTTTLNYITELKINGQAVEFYYAGNDVCEYDAVSGQIKLVFSAVFTAEEVD